MPLLHYNIAAIILFLVILLSLRNKNIKTSSARIFIILISIGFLASFFNLASSIIINFKNISLVAIRITHAFYIGLFNLTYILYFYYIIALDKKNKNKFLHFVLLFFTAAVILVCAIGVYNENIIRIDLGGKIINGIGIYSLYIVASIYCAIMLIFILVRLKQIRFKNALPVIFYIIIHLVSIILEIYYMEKRGENINILNFSNAISMLIIYISLENPKSYIDNQTNALNTTTFYDELEYLIHFKKKFEVTSIYFSDLKFLLEKIGYENYSNIQKEIASILRKKYSKKIYYISDNQYVLINSYNTNNLKHEGIELSEYELNLRPKVINFNYPKNIKTKEEIIRLLALTKENISNDAFNKVQREIVVEELLRKCIQDKSFIVNFQPIYNVARHGFKSAEVLVRMPENKAFPDEFIPLAEKLGLINKVDEIIMEKAFKFIRQNDLDKILDRIEINLSPVECLNKNLCKRVLKLLDKYSIRPSFLNLEVLETAEILENEVFINNIEGLRDKGVGFSLDDFGTGYSNIINMANYPYNIIKIDKSILYNSYKSNKAKTLFMNLTKLIFSMGYDIIIEGVETEEQFNLVKSLNINLIQGYFFSRPLSMDDFLKKLKGE